MIGDKFSNNEEKDHHLRMAIFESAAPNCLDPEDLDKFTHLY
jgi:hypothetical protein